MGIDIPGFIRHLRNEDPVGALERIRQANPFPAICGRICPAPCENACIFYEEGSPISIRALERFAADNGRSKTPKEKASDKGKKVAVIGSGPAGMSATYILARAGFGVTMFEAMNEAGGLLRYGVPEFRLPQKVLNEQVAELKALGVNIVTNCLAGSSVSLREISTQGYAATLLTVGAGVPVFSQISGYSSAGVYYAEEILLRLQITDKSRLEDVDRIFKGPSTVVIGGGMPALDVARLARRFGQEVNVLFNGLEEQLGARPDDVQEAVEEGVRIQAPVEVMRIEADDANCARGLQCRRLEMTEQEDKLSLQPVAGEPEFVEAQTVIFSNGRRPNDFLRRDLPLLKWNEDGSLWIDPQTGLTSVEKVFAAGNVTTGAGAVVDAIASGKLAAQKIMDFLK